MSKKALQTGHDDDHHGRLEIEYLATSALTPDPRNARKHSAKQIAKLAHIISEFGWSSPIIIDELNMVLAGHARLQAAKSLRMTDVPCVRLPHLDAPAKKALAIADNAMTDASSFDDSILRETLIELTGLEFDLDLTGLEMGVIDFLIDGSPSDAPMDPADLIEAPNSDQPAITRSGDLWLLGEHRLLCGNALEPDAYQTLMGDERASMVFSDPPYNVPINGHVSGLGRHQHREFAMASGEMSEDQFRSFLTTAMQHMCAFARDGSIHFLCIDWRHVRTMLEAGDKLYTELKNIVVWNKTNGSMGSLYRSKHELIVVFKQGTASHVNHVALGKHGRHRTNVWDYPGANAFGKSRDRDLAAHSTPKPIALVADAMRDCSDRGDLILDPFMGSGTTIMAAERSARRAAGMEIDPLYVDSAVRRWE
ncbi:MAG: DNA methyltransferase [Pseudomonadota bacterium]|uniref:site-specific DNA-methyltransferase n=1 Tax=Sphingobium sp. TaxID=1912891 RepID=UPI002E1AA5D4